MSLLDRIRAVASQLDDDALAALASKGLVRRARKDVAAAPPVILGESGGRVRLRVEDRLVELTERPADSRCDCPAGGTCRHVLSAWMHLAAGTAGSSDSPSEEELCAELLGIADEELRRWAGAALLRRANREIAEGLQVEWATPVARIPEWNVEARWLAGGGLPGMLCSCRGEAPCLHRVAAVLAWQIQKGIRAPAPLESDLESSTEAPRTREEVRVAAMKATEDLIVQGLSRVAPSTVERLRTLATSAHGVDLPRLERVLRGLADELAAWLERSARASEEALLFRCATAHALGRALQNPKPALVGAHRSRYERVRELTLAGAGARVWRAASGYHGLTVYFWDSVARNWSTWTDARPLGTPSFDPQDRWCAPGPWPGCESPAVASTSSIRLLEAWRSRTGRLSGRGSTTMSRTGPSGAACLPEPIAQWSELATRAREVLAGGLGQQDERKLCVLLKPSAWRPARFDSLAQELSRTIIDVDGKGVSLLLSQAAENQPVISELEALQPSASVLVFGLLRIVRGELAVLPISLVEENRIVNLGLRRDAKDASAIEPEESLESEGESDQESGDVEGPQLRDDILGRLCTEAWAALEVVVAGGVAAYREWKRFDEVAKRADTLGLATVAERLRRVADVAAGSSERERVARAVLGAAWVLSVTRSTATVQYANAALENTADRRRQSPNA